MSVYLYKPPTIRMMGRIRGALVFGITTSTVVWRQGGQWFNAMDASMELPDVTDVDVDADTGLRLFFTKPMVVPGSLHDALAALQPADPSWTPGSLTLL